MTRQCCRRCGAAILGPVHVVELSRLTHEGPECQAFVICSGCGDAIRAYLTRRPEVLDPNKLHTVTR